MSTNTARDASSFRSCLSRSSIGFCMCKRKRPWTTLETPWTPWTAETGLAVHCRAAQCSVHRSATHHCTRRSNWRLMTLRLQLATGHGLVLVLLAVVTPPPLVCLSEVPDQPSRRAKHGTEDREREKQKRGTDSPFCAAWVSV